MAAGAAVIVPDSALKYGGTMARWDIGSDTLKNMKLDPIPTLKSIAIQAKSLNSFSASTPPILIEPYLLRAKYNTVIINRFTTPRYHQAKFNEMKLNIDW
jgi:hypothetical protein